ncbi:MAG: ATP-binding protein [Thermoleophilia bacterium]
MEVPPPPRRLTREQWRAARFVAAALGLTALTALLLLPFRDDLTPGTLALLMLLPPLVASGAGLIPTLACAAAGAMTFNLVFTQPYGSPRISTDESVAAFVVYLVVAAALAVALSALRESREADRRRARTLEMLETLGEGLLRGHRLDPALRSGMHELLRLVPLRGAAISVPGEEPLMFGAGDAAAAERAIAYAADPGGGVPTVRSLRMEGRIRVFPVMGGEDAVGLLAADPGDEDPDEDRWSVVEGFADLAGLGVARARLERERALRSALENTDRMRVALTRSVTHDLRTPLAVIRTAAAAAREAPDPAVRGELLDDIEREGARLSHLVANMLDLSRIEAGALTVQRAPVPVDELVHDAVAAVPAPEGAVTVDVSADLPPFPLDEALVRQVLVNLVGNAVAHGGGRVEVSAGIDGGELELRVADHGPGIPEAERRRVFEPYRRLRPSGRVSGSGLGLAICRGYVEAHGGTVAVGTTPGGGATFTVRLPEEAP